MKSEKISMKYTDFMYFWQLDKIRFVFFEFFL